MNLTHYFYTVVFSLLSVADARSVYLCEPLCGPVVAPSVSRLSVIASLSQVRMPLQREVSWHVRLSVGKYILLKLQFLKKYISCFYSVQETQPLQCLFFINTDTVL